MVDRTAWDDKRGVYKLTQNANFVAQIKAALDQRGLGPDAEVITLCRPAASAANPAQPFCAPTVFQTPALWSTAFRARR